MGKIIIDGKSLTIEKVVHIARGKEAVLISGDAYDKVRESRKIVDEIVKNDVVKYGITTGFGKFADVTITQDDCKTLQRNLIISHACGFGEPFSIDETRAIMLLRINNLVKGYSGIRVETLNTLLEMLNKGVTPIIPQKGSLGASGDLAPLAHMVLPMLGEGEAVFNGERMSGKKAMELAGIDIIELTAKEGLALINGTQVMTAVGVLALYDSKILLEAADITSALTLEALRGIRDAFNPAIHEIRPHQGQINTAENILKLVEGSTFITSQGEIRVQDAYSLRCIPQVHGASKDAYRYVREKVEIEINSVTDNPIITREGEVYSGGNFHGQPMAIIFDFLGIAMSEIGNISERRLERLINYQLNDLPAFLVKKGGLNSGYMITQYAAAALVSENKILAHPASVDSIPSSANQEDHVSMGTIAARKARDIINNTYRVVATEIMAACQAIDFREGFKLGEATQTAYSEVRKEVQFIEEDIVMYKDLDLCTELLRSEKINNAVNEITKINI